MGVVGLQAVGAARRAGAAPMQPIAVSVQAVLDVVGTYNNSVAAADFCRLGPSQALHFQKFKITAVAGVSQQAVGQLVQHAEAQIITRMARIISYGVGPGRPVLSLARLKSKLGVVTGDFFYKRIRG